MESESGEWSQRVEEWSQRVETENGDREWRVETESGDRELFLRLYVVNPLLPSTLELHGEVPIQSALVDVEQLLHPVIEVVIGLAHQGPLTWSTHDSTLFKSSTANRP